MDLALYVVSNNTVNIVLVYIVYVVWVSATFCNITILHTNEVD